MATKPSAAQIKAATAKIDPVAVTSAVINETPELAEPLLARGAITKGVDEQGNTVYVVGNDTNTIHNIGEYIMSYQPAQNAYLNALANRIGMTIITSKLYDNSWAMFKRGYLEFGETIEEIFVNLAKPFGYSPSKAETNVFKRQIPDVRAAFHRMDYQKYYKVTISNDQLRQAFLSWTGISDLIARIVDSMYTAASTDEFYVMKYLLAKSLLNGYIQPVQIANPIDKANATDIATVFQAQSEKLRFQSTKFTMSGVTTHTDWEDQYLIMTADFKSLMNMNVLATAFNVEYAELMGRIVTVDSLVEHDWERLTELFTDPDTGEVDPDFTVFNEDQLTLLEKVPAVMTSRDFWAIWDNFFTMTELYNGEGLYWNYWYHTWKTFSISPFGQAVAYTSQAWSITGVTISPTTATVDKGQNVVFTATVTGTGIINQNVTYTISGQASSGTTINPENGTLHVAKDETATTITVNAVSVGDQTKKGTATVTVNA